MEQKTRIRAHAIVSHIERFFQTDISYIMSGGFWLSGNQIYAAIVAFALSIAFAHVIPKESYGVYKYILSAGGIISALSLTGLGTAVLQSTSRGYDGVLKQAFKTSLAWSIVPIGASVCGSMYYLIHHNVTLGLAFIVIAICNPLIQSAFLYKSFLNGKKRFQTTSHFGVIQNTLSSLTIFFAILFTPSPLSLAIAYFGSNAVIGLILYAYTQRTYVLNTHEDAGAMSYGKHMSLINILDTIATHIDKILLFQILGGTALAVYTFAIAIPEQLRAFFKIIPQLAIPKFATQHIHSIQQTIFPKIGKIMLLTIPLIVAYILTAPYIFQLFFPAYRESVIYSQVFCLILITEGGLSGAVLKAQRAIKEQYILNVSTNICKIILLCVLSITYGIWGIIIARIIGRYISFIIGIYILKRLA